MNIQQFDFSIDLLQSLLWQYNDAINLQSLLNKKQLWYDVNQEQFWLDWFSDVFDLDTANDFGLSVWSIILNLPLYIGPTPDPPGKPIFGFESFNENFEHGNFSSQDTYIGLTTEEKRLVLKLRYFQLVSRGASPEINRFLNFVFKDFLPGKVYVIDGLDMSMTTVFTSPPPPILYEYIKQYDLIPRPSGVKMNYFMQTGKIFGFESFNQNFGQGNFLE